WTMRRVHCEVASYVRQPVAPAQRPRVPLFHDASLRQYTHGKLDRLFRAAMMTACFGKAVESAFNSWHFYRSGLATALHAAGVDDASYADGCAPPRYTFTGAWDRLATPAWRAAKIEERVLWRGRCMVVAAAGVRESAGVYARPSSLRRARFPGRA
ncbi:MAG: hypothetical protein SGPRY_014460, partial [Prymnesium sp.]